MRPVLPFALAAVLLVGLAGCTGATSDSGGDETTSAGCPAAPSGKGSDSVKVEGDEGAEPTVTFDSPISVMSTQRTVVTKGDGDKVEEGSLISVSYVVSNGATGEVLEASGYGDTGPLAIPISESSMLPGLYKELVCTTAGSRVVAVIPPGDGFGDNGSNVGLGATDNLVIVADVVELLPLRATGEEQAPEAGFPTVALAKNGEPTITVPSDLAIPAATTSSVTILGDGAAIAAGDTVTVQYVGVTADDGKVFDSSWANGAPLTSPLGGLIAGWSAGLVGKTVGSQVILVIPDAEAYAGQGNDLDGKNLIFVIDILATAA